MPHSKRTGRWFPDAEAAPSAALASAARTTNGQSSSFDTGDARVLDVTLSITAISGASATLVLTLQTSHDGTVWDDVGAFPAKTATGTHTKTFGALGPLCRFAWTITGTTPNVTFSASVKERR